MIILKRLELLITMTLLLYYVTNIAKQEKDAENTLDSWNYTIFRHLFGEFLSFKTKKKR